MNSNRPSTALKLSALPTELLGIVKNNAVIVSLLMMTKASKFLYDQTAMPHPYVLSKISFGAIKLFQNSLYLPGISRLGLFFGT